MVGEVEGDDDMLVLPNILNDEKGIVLRDLPPLISEDEILESLSHIGKVSSIHIFNKDFYGADKSTCSANTRLRSFLQNRLDLKSSNVLKTGKVKMAAKNPNTETPIFAFVEFEDMKSKETAMSPALKVFGCRLASEISTDTFPRSYFVEARGSKSGGEKGKSGGTDASLLDAMKIENSCKISDIKEFCTIELHSTKYSANRMEYANELNDKLSEMFTISGSPNEYPRDNSTSLGMQEDIDVANALVQDGKCYLHFPTFIAAQKAYNALMILSNSNEGVFEQPMRVKWYLSKSRVLDTDTDADSRDWKNTKGFREVEKDKDTVFLENLSNLI